MRQLPDSELPDISPPDSELPESSLIGMSVDSDEAGIGMALDLARKASEKGEVPVGAVVVLDGKVIAAGMNQPITMLDPTAHAEMVAIRAAAKTVGNYRLVGATLFVTLEPCTMCFGALVHSRIQRLVYGAREPKAGVVESAMTLPESPAFNHMFSITGGIREQECSQVMSDFFAMRRERKKLLRQASKGSDHERE